MKYTIEGFNQRNAIALGLNSEDLVLLRWFVDFKNTSDMKKKYIKQVNDMGYWISYSYLIEELPILFSIHPQYSIQNYDELPGKEKFELNKKYIKACKQKIKRIMSGNLAKVLLRNKSTERDDKGKVKSEIYVHMNPAVFKLLISDDIAGVQKCTTDTVVQKCTTDTVVQKCTIYPSTITSYPSTTQKVQKSKDFSSSKQKEKDKNIKLIEEKTHLIINSKNKENKCKKFDYSRLEKSIEIFLKEKGEYFSLLEKIYNDDKNFVNLSSNNNNVYIPKNRAHNVNATFTNYEPDELEKMLQENQKGKFKSSTVSEEDHRKLFREKDYRSLAIKELQSKTSLKVEDNAIWKKVIDEKEMELIGIDLF